MTKKELDKKALYLSLDITKELKFSDDIIDLSVKFAIDILEEVQKENELSFLDMDLDNYLGKKIQELKQYLDETNKTK